MDPVAAPQGHAPVLPPPQFIDPISEIAGKILFSIGIIFATVPIWSYFAAIAVPNPFLIAIGGIAFCILGLRILINNVAPPQTQPPSRRLHHRQRSLSTGNLRELDEAITPTGTPRLKKVSSAGNLAKLAAPRAEKPEKALFQHEREIRVIDDESVPRRLRKTREWAQEQIEAEPLYGWFGEQRRNWKIPIELDSASKVYTTPIGIATTTMTMTPVNLLGETYICAELKFANGLSNQAVEDTTVKTFRGSFLAVLSGHKNMEALDFVAQFLIPTLTSHLTTRRLSEKGIFNSLKLTFAELDASCYEQRVKGSVSLLVTLFLGKRIWVANIEHGRAFFVSNELLAQVQKMQAAKNVPHEDPPEEEDTFQQAPTRKSVPLEDLAVEDPEALAAWLKENEEEAPSFVDDHNISFQSVADDEPHRSHEVIPFPTALSVATDLRDRVFQKSAEKREGEVEEALTLMGPVLIVGKLNHARIIGGHDEGPKHIGARPKITCLRLDQEGYLVIGSEGFNQLYAPSRQVVKYLSENLEKTEAQIAQELVDITHRAGSFLNITVMVAKITSETLGTALGET